MALQNLPWREQTSCMIAKYHLVKSIANLLYWHQTCLYTFGLYIEEFCSIPDHVEQKIWIQRKKYYLQMKGSQVPIFEVPNTDVFNHMNVLTITLICEMMIFNVHRYQFTWFITVYNIVQSPQLRTNTSILNSWYHTLHGPVASLNISYQKYYQDTSQQINK